MDTAGWVDARVSRDVRKLKPRFPQYEEAEVIFVHQSDDRASFIPPHPRLIATTRSFCRSWISGHFSNSGWDNPLLAGAGAAETFFGTPSRLQDLCTSGGAFCTQPEAGTGTL